MFGIFHDQLTFITRLSNERLNYSCSMKSIICRNEQDICQFFYLRLSERFNEFNICSICFLGTTHGYFSAFTLSLNWNVDFHNMTFITRLSNERLNYSCSMKSIICRNEQGICLFFYLRFLERFNEFNICSICF